MSNDQNLRSSKKIADSNGLTRRTFLHAGGVAGAAIGLDPVLAAAAANGANTSEAGGPRIRKRVSLGKTGIEVPDISFGTFSLESDEGLIEHAYDRGITHFDTAEGYTGHRAEEVLGRALRGKRQDVTITSKFWANPENTADEQMRVLEESLRRLQTDYIDIYLNHAVNDIARLQSEEWQSFCEQAKKEGKVRKVGMSGHSGRLGDCIEYALEENLVDVILVAYSFAQQPSFKESLKKTLSDWLPSLDIVSGESRLPELLARAHGEGVGVMVMKTLKGARLNDMRPFERPGRTFAQSAFRWVLSEPSVDGLVVSMTSREMIDEYVEASGTGPVDGEDLALLARYSARNAGTSCLVGCGDCAGACPAGVPIADVMRMRMYDRDYGQTEIASREYDRLEVDATACLSCSGAPCATACPAGLQVPELNRDTARRLGRPLQESSEG
jgi:predicted aldo/keto reductase-like oxidoreductase